jgi:hypothetical protein
MKKLMKVATYILKDIYNTNYILILNVGVK